MQVDHAIESGASDHERWVIFLQYHLHKLFVLSVYYPARGFDLFPSTVALNERLELLKSSQTAIRLHQTGMGIWSNWDLVVRHPYFRELDLLTEVADDHLGSSSHHPGHNGWYLDP